MSPYDDLSGGQVRRTALSKKELQRGGVMARVKAGELRLKDAAELMRVSYRQAKRIWQRYGKGGTKALKHGNAGRASNRRRPQKERKKILHKVEEKYGGFGPTLAAEHLASEDQLEVHSETLRRWMLEEGLWKRARQRKQHRKSTCPITMLVLRGHQPSRRIIIAKRRRPANWSRYFAWSRSEAFPTTG